MRTVWMAIGVCVAALASLPGCRTTQPDLKPNLPEEYVLPPENDPRYSSNPTFPKETLNTGPVKRFSGPMQQPGSPMRGQGRMGGPGGMGGGY